ncbi:hypothetical protein AYO49_04265 [Verrucomicrobiaceae bacterium SCGC AG-212-N21]|nr:hypothetical protein AYO49_04265 [Verrucomicrobiaceae bacterium SCGC AG-212-N21]
MSHPWSLAKLRSLRNQRGAALLFGFMHEDPAPELALLPPGGSAACVLSAGDIAFALAQAGASRIIAADVNAAQHALVRLKLALAQRDWKLSDVRHTTIREALASSYSFSWLTPDVEPRLRDAHVLNRHVTSAGDVDTRLATLARFIIPLITSGNFRDPGFAQRTITTFRWSLAWRGMDLLLRLLFPATLRAHLPRDISHRLRHRLESALRSPHASQNSWLHRLLLPPSKFDETSLATSWPNAQIDPARLLLHEGPLDAAIHHGAFDLIATSNIFDTTPAGSLNTFLDAISPHVHPGSTVLVRSLFRDPLDWPAPPAGWFVNSSTLERLSTLDRSPLCRVSLAIERL